MDGDAVDLVLKIIFFILVAVMLSLPIVQVALWIWRKYRGGDE